MTAERLEDELADLIDRALAIVGKDDVISSLEHAIKEIRSGGYDPSMPPLKAGLENEIKAELDRWADGIMAERFGMDERDLSALPELIALFHQLGDMAYRHEAITWERGVEILNKIQRYHGLLEYACVVCRDTEPKF